MIKTLIAKLVPLAFIIAVLWWLITDPQSFTSTMSSLFRTVGGVLGEGLKSFAEWAAEQTGDGR